MFVVTISIDCVDCIFGMHLKEQVLDPKTRLMLYKLVNGEVLEAVNGCISTGKEACVFHANGGRCVTIILIIARTFSRKKIN